MIPTLKRMFVAALGVLALAGTARAQSTSEAVSQLAKNAEYWQERGREDKAAEAWARVLTADPRDEEALVWLTGYYTRIGKSDIAEEYLNRLRDTHPKSPEIPKLERALSLGERYDILLDEARSAARAGHRDEAILKYRELFGGTEPPNPLALEYYETLGGSPSGWTEARNGLQSLVKRYPGEPRYQLALARHLTYREETRADGIRMLERLSTNPVVGKQAEKDWREALGWAGRSKSGAPLIASYLASHPNDKQLAEQLKSARATQYRTSEVNDAFDALNKNNLSDAERRLDRLGAKDPEALTGRGILALKRGQFTRARDYLEQARNLAPSRPNLWKKALQSARFWLLMKEAQTAEDGGKMELAEKKYLDAIDADPDERFQADAKLANLYLAWNKRDRMEDRVRIILQEKATDANGLHATIAVLLQTDQLDRAIVLNEQLKKLDDTKAYPDAQLRAAVLCGDAGRAHQAGHLAEAKALLLQACDVDPAWFQPPHDLANLLMSMNELEEAQVYAQRAAELDPDNPEAHMTLLRLMEAQGRNEDALTAIQEMSPDQVTQEVRDMQARIELKMQVASAIRHLDEGDEAGARTELLALDLKVEAQPDMVPVVAQAWATLGDDDHAISMFQKILSKNPAAPPGVRLQLAALLYKVGRDNDALEVLSKIGDDVSPSEKAGIENIRVAAVVQQAENLRAKRDFAGAAALLRPLANDYPRNVSVLCALGRLFEAGGESASATAAFQHALQIDPDNLEARSGAIGNALTSGDDATADRLLKEAIDRKPKDPNVHLMAARIWERRNDDARATEELKRAQELSHDQQAAAGTMSQPKKTDAQTAVSNEPMNSHSSSVAMADHAQVVFAGGKTSTSAQTQSATTPLDKEIAAEVDRVNQRHRYEFFPGIEFRYRAGQAGLGQLTALRIPVGAAIPLGWRGHLSFVVTPTLVDGGSVNLGNPGTAAFYGSGPDPTKAPAPFEQLVGGAELKLQYDQPDLEVDIGSTPLGFPLMSAQGGIEWTPRFGIVGLDLEASRRPITDSVLSWAGVGDPVTGKTWGEEFRNGGRFGLSFTAKTLLFYMFGDYRFIQGTNVPFNHEIQGGAGVDWTALVKPDWKVVVGLDVIALGYTQNLSFFTYGQGGYFSPQAFVHVGIPVAFGGMSSQVRWSVKVEPGLNWIKESAANFYPTVSGRVPPNLTTNGITAPAAFSTPPPIGPSIDAHAQVLVPFTPDTEGGFDLTLHASIDYIEVIAGFVVKFGWAR